jgi:ferredoxin, 2Fe-2S
MYDIVIENLNNKRISYNGNPKLLLDILKEKGIEWMHACGGKGRCTTCRFELLSLPTTLSKPSDLEKKASHLGKLKPNERMACQSVVTGDIIIKVPQLYKFPHVKYTD